MMKAMAHDHGASDYAESVDERPERAKHRVRLPDFIVQEPVGAGRAIKRITRAVGIQACAPCAQRAARLDRWLQFEPRR